jgi:type III secretion protein D
MDQAFMGQAFELRVLHGLQRGARSRLAAGASCVLAVTPDGCAEEADIVLREEGAPAARLRITPGEANATLEVLEGAARLGERALVAGDQALWPSLQRLAIGEAVVAFGPSEDTAWDAQIAWDAAAERHARDGEGSIVPAGPVETASPAVTGRRRFLRPEVLLTAVGGLAAILCAGAMWIGHPAATPLAANEEDIAAQLTQKLQGSEFPALAVARDPLGRIRVSGRLGTMAERTRLDAWLADQKVAATVNVDVDELIVRNVVEVFRVNSVTVQAQSTGPGQVAAEAAEPDPAVLAHAEEAVRRDVRGLQSLAVRNTATPKAPPVPVVAEDPNKRIATVVAGDPAYVVTVDGARYFVGALLPTGHRITDIEGQQVTLERSGQETVLNF